MQLARTLAAVSELTQQFDNVSYSNLLSDKSFAALDFFDADHVNEIGAKKLTTKMDSLFELKMRH